MIRNDIFLKEVGKRIRQIRKSQKISLREMEKLTAFDDDNLCRLENGKKNSHILTLKAIADVLNVDVKDFL